MPEFRALNGGEQIALSCEGVQVYGGKDELLKCWGICFKKWISWILKSMHLRLVNGMLDPIKSSTAKTHQLEIQRPNLAETENYPWALGLGRKGCKKSLLSYFACNKTGWRARIKEENRTILTLELCRSETEVRCRMQGTQEAQVMQVMQNQVKSQLRSSGEGEGGGHWGRGDPYAGRGRGWLTSSADSHSFPIPYLTYPAATALSTTFL